MKFKGTLSAILFAGLQLIIISCSGQNLTQSSPPPPPGDTVKALGVRLLHVFQDSKNNYWFGSNGEGVYRYDGKIIVRFTAKHGLCHNKIEEIREDRSGNMYFNTNAGICKFDGQTFTTLPVMSKSPDAWKLEPDDLWFKGAQDSGLVYRYDGKYLYRLMFPETKAGKAFISKYPRSDYPAMTFSPYDVYTTYKDRKGNIWFGTGTLGVCRYNGRSFDWIAENDLTELDEGAANGVRSIIEDKDGNFWFSNTLYKYQVYAGNSSGNEEMTYKREKSVGNLDGNKESGLDFYLSAAKDNKDELWIATYNAGVWRYNGKNITHYPIKDNNKTVTLFSVYKDKQGSLWLGTHDAGVYKFNGKTFEKFKP